MNAADWWAPPWRPGSEQDPDSGWTGPGPAELPEQRAAHAPGAAGDAAILATLEEQLGQVRSKDRVRDLAEVFTHQREIDAILDLIPDAFTALDVKFLEPACGSGNFLTELLRRKLRLVARARCASGEHYEHQLLRAAAAIYGIDISPENVTEARGRMAHVLLEHYQFDANTTDPSTGFLTAAAAILAANIVAGDTLEDAWAIELCDWRPHPGGRFQRVWSPALVPPAERDLFWAERVQDRDPVHYSRLAEPAPAPEARTVGP